MGREDRSDLAFFQCKRHYVATYLSSDGKTYSGSDMMFLLCF